MNVNSTATRRPWALLPVLVIYLCLLGQLTVSLLLILTDRGLTSATKCLDVLLVLLTDLTAIGVLEPILRRWTRIA